MSNPNKPELPRVGHDRSEVITAVSRYTYTVSVTDVATDLSPTNGAKFTRFGIQNPASNTQSVFVGGSDVDNDSSPLAGGQTRGRELPVGSDRDEDTTLAPWAIAPAGETVVVVVEISL